MNHNEIWVSVGATLGGIGYTIAEPYGWTWCIIGIISGCSLVLIPKFAFDIYRQRKYPTQTERQRVIDEWNQHLGKTDRRSKR